MKYKEFPFVISFNVIVLRVSKSLVTSETKKEIFNNIFMQVQLCN